MTAWLSEEWVDAVADELAGLEGPSSLTGSVQVDVTGGPDGDVGVHAVLDGGRLVALRPGPTPAPDAVLTLTDADARAVVDGQLDPAVAFMRGRMKVAGDMALVLDLLVLSGSDAARAGRARVAALTSG